MICENWVICFEYEGKTFAFYVTICPVNIYWGYIRHSKWLFVGTNCATWHCRDMDSCWGSNDDKDMVSIDFAKVTRSCALCAAPCCRWGMLHVSSGCARMLQLYYWLEHCYSAVRHRSHAWTQPPRRSVTDSIRNRWTSSKWITHFLEGKFTRWHHADAMHCNVVGSRHSGNLSWTWCSWTSDENPWALEW